MIQRYERLKRPDLHSTNIAEDDESEGSTGDVSGSKTRKMARQRNQPFRERKFSM